jgi:cyclic pyranopterin phosphate synthase
MRDKLGREIEYLRISVTPNCNLNCIYCMPDRNRESHRCGEWLKASHFKTVVGIMAELGINKIRLTGGEPLLRPDICEIISGISEVSGIKDISITTNGLKLSKMAKALKASGLKRINLSLDSLKTERYEYITGGGSLGDVLAGMESAIKEGLLPLKINIVVIKGINDSEVDGFIDLAKDLPLEIRFIELMPIGTFGEKNRDKLVFNNSIINAHPQLIPCEHDSRSPARYFRIDQYKGKIGFISPMSHKFCNECNRIRLTYDGKIRPCLGHNGEADLTGELNGSVEKLREKIIYAIYEKPVGHNFKRGFSSNRNMYAIGG